MAYRRFNSDHSSEEDRLQSPDQTFSSSSTPATPFFLEGGAEDQDFEPESRNRSFSHDNQHPPSTEIWDPEIWDAAYLYEAYDKDIPATPESSNNSGSAKPPKKTPKPKARGAITPPFQSPFSGAHAMPGYRSMDNMRTHARTVSSSTTNSANLVGRSVPDLNMRPPAAPFMGVRGNYPYVYHGAAAAATSARTSSGSIPFRAPFLAPSSRAASSLWSPPSYSAHVYSGNAAASTASLVAMASRPKPPLPSARLQSKLSDADKPWIRLKNKEDRASWWITFLCIVLGVCGAAALCYFSWRNVHILKDSQLCIVMEDDFSGPLDLTNNWNRDVELGGFGNGEFQITTNDDANSYTSNGNLYLMPTLTSDAIGSDEIFEGGNYTVPGCTTTNASACSASSNGAGTVINPVMSARLNTQGKYSIQYGKVEVRAKLPRGDWLWPAIWMLPDNETYGAWPLSGEIDIMEARGNRPNYPGQGSNFVRSSLNYGPMPTLLKTIYGWFSTKQASFDQGFHTYSLEWTKDWMRFYTDSRLHAMLDLSMSSKKQSFAYRGGFPQTAPNGSDIVVVPDPWTGGSWAAPFDQSFYLIINLAAGGTSGWFPDNVGGKPWDDGSTTAMYDFAKAQDIWYSTWPSSANNRAFRIEYVKMWSLCKP